jgi:hypothetical protein
MNRLVADRNSIGKLQDIKFHRRLNTSAGLLRSAVNATDACTRLPRRNLFTLANYCSTTLITRLRRPRTSERLSLDSVSHTSSILAGWHGPRIWYYFMATSSTFTSALEPTATPSPGGLSDDTPAVHHASPVVAFIIGLSIILLASVLNAAGLNLTKLDHVRMLSVKITIQVLK